MIANTAPIVAALAVSVALSAHATDVADDPAVALAAPVTPHPATPSDPGAVAVAPERWNAGFQTTYILQRKAGFQSPYTGPNSLVTDPETGYTLSATAYLGARPWTGAEVFFNPETIQTKDISHLSGLGGLANGENQKGGGPVPTLYRARAFLRQTFDLGGETSAVESGPNQLAGTSSSRRLVVTAGNFSWGDVFDGSATAHDPRTQFLNWSLMSYGAADYAADVRGYTWGLTVEYDHDDWAFRIGRFAQPQESNGLPIDFDLVAHYGDTIEVEHAHTIAGRPGKLRVTGIHNSARMGAFGDALRHAQANGGTPDVGAVRKEQSKWGVGIGLDQELARDVALFARFSWNDGHTETYAFAEIERSLSAGVSVKGRWWRRAGDTFGLAFAVNGLSRDHQDYLAAGGVGFLIGDGRINYRPEQILEAYYSLNATRGVWVSIDAQHIVNPAYNADRGPVDILGGRIHVQL